MGKRKKPGIRENEFPPPPPPEGISVSSSSSKGRWINLLFLSLTLNVAFFTSYLYDKGRTLPVTITTTVIGDLRGFSSEEKQEEQEQALGKGHHRMGSLHLPEPESGITSDRSMGAVQKMAPDAVINFDRGDPTMYETFWLNAGEKSSIVIPGWQTISYFSDVGNICWFLERKFAQEIKKLHLLVGNAETRDRHIIVGTGSTQLFQAALFALSPPDLPEPMSVVCALPYYSSYPAVTDYLKSGLYKWAGDAYTFNRDTPYIELVTSPNNPDGSIRQAIVNKAGGLTIHDLAYYWPQYTPITYRADHDIMLFTVSKSTGHAGTRIGWALVKDKDVAERMTKFIELNTIGVSKDSQLRAARILQSVREGYERIGPEPGFERFFDFGYQHMAERWERLRVAVSQSSLFSLPVFPSGFCSFAGEVRTSHPAFAWLKCEGEVEDCEAFLKKHRILTRSGKDFGSDPKYVRVSMLDRDPAFDLFVQRLSALSK